MLRWVRDKTDGSISLVGSGSSMTMEDKLGRGRLKGKSKLKFVQPSDFNKTLKKEHEK
jgi:hypothetical protein